jgi:hypothetical protein
VCRGFWHAVGLTWLALSGCGQIRNAPDRELSDADLLKMAAEPFFKARMMNRSYSVGRHHGIPVRVEFPCGDVCPDYTAKIVRYDVEPRACPPAYGEVLTVGVPGGAAVLLREFCFPRVLRVTGFKRPTPSASRAPGLAPELGRGAP